MSANAHGALVRVSVSYFNTVNFGVVSDLPSTLTVRPACLSQADLPEQDELIEVLGGQQSQ